MTKKLVALRIEPKIESAIDRLAQLTGRKRSAVMREAMEKGLRLQVAEFKAARAAASNAEKGDPHA